MASSRGFSVNVEMSGRPRPGARNTIDLSVEMGEVRGRERDREREGREVGREIIRIFIYQCLKILLNLFGHCGR